MPNYNGKVPSIADLAPTTKVSKQYLPLYLSEISYRYNDSHNPMLFMSVLRNGLMTNRVITPAA